MSETRTYADIDLAVIPAQRGAIDDLIEILYDEPAPAFSAGAPARERAGGSRVVLAALAMCLGVAAGVPIGVHFSGRHTAGAAAAQPAGPAAGATLQHLLQVPLRDVARAKSATTQRQLIRQMLTQPR
jgi:hypothetical protein